MILNVQYLDHLLHTKLGIESFQHRRSTRWHVWLFKLWKHRTMEKIVVMFVPSTWCTHLNMGDIIFHSCVYVCVCACVCVCVLWYHISNLNRKTKRKRKKLGRQHPHRPVKIDWIHIFLFIVFTCMTMRFLFYRGLSMRIPYNGCLFTDFFGAANHIF